MIQLRFKLMLKLVQICTLPYIPLCLAHIPFPLMQSAAQLSMAWVQEGPRIILKPATMTDIDTICKTPERK